MLPQDPMILLSYVNTAMRDGGYTLEEFCLEQGLSQEELEKKLGELGFVYDPESRRFY